MPLYTRPPVTSATWSGSVFQAGAVLQDVEVIKQRMYNVINTPVGSDPLRPFFGTNIYDYIDRPIQVAVAAVKREIADAIALWLPEVKLDSIKYSITSNGAVSGAEFKIYSTWNTKPLPVMSFGLNRGSFVFNGLKGTLIASADIPYNRAGDNYMPVFTVDGVAASPAPTVGGYASMAALLADAQANWSGYGVWGMGASTLVCYLKGEYKKAKLRIDLV